MVDVVRNFGEPDERREFELGFLDLVTVGPLTFGRETLEPGWRWSTHVKPIAGTERCEFHHVGFQISGRWICEARDGTQVKIGPGEIYDTPPGHDSWVIGDEPSVSIDFQGIADWAARPTGSRVLTTVLFTDIVGSTAAAERMGDAAWHRLLAQHLDDVRSVLATHEGTLVDTTGDGVLARFDSPAAAVRAASGIAIAAERLGIETRAGVHTGEVELVEGNLGGVSVHLGARIMAEAGPGEVLVSSTTRELVGGGDLEFVERGSFELKGISGPRTLYQLVREAPRL